MKLPTTVKSRREERTHRVPTVQFEGTYKPSKALEKTIESALADGVARLGAFCTYQQAKGLNPVKYDRCVDPQISDMGVGIASLVSGLIESSLTYGAKQALSDHINTFKPPISPTPEMIGTTDRLVAQHAVAPHIDQSQGRYNSGTSLPPWDPKLLRLGVLTSLALNEPGTWKTYPVNEFYIDRRPGQRQDVSSRRKMPWAGKAGRREFDQPDGTLVVARHGDIIHSVEGPGDRRPCVVDIGVKWPNLALLSYAEIRSMSDWAQTMHFEIMSRAYGSRIRGEIKPIQTNFNPNI